MARPIFYGHLFCLFVTFVAVHAHAKCKACFRPWVLSVCEFPGSVSDQWCEKRCPTRMYSPSCPATLCHCPDGNSDDQLNLTRIFRPPPIYPEFEVEVRYDDEESCVGVVIIRRNTTCPPENVTLSEDAATDRLIKEKYGPDAFMVRIRGPEVIRVPMHHKSGCVYQGRFRLSLPGPHVVHADHVYENYNAMTEQHDQKSGPEMKWWTDHPRYLFNRTLTKGIALQCRTPVRDASVHNYIVEGRRQSLNEFNGQSLPPSVILDLQRQKPPCSDGLVASEGRWTLKTSIAPTPSTWVTGKDDAAAAAAWVWTPFNCSLSSMEFTNADAYKCLKGKTVELVGDSQQRSIFYKLANYIRKKSEQFRTNKKISHSLQLHPSFGPHDPSTTVRYDKDNFLKNFWMETVRAGKPKFDAVFLGYGNWPASGAGAFDKSKLMSLEKFKQDVASKAASIEEFMRNHPNVSVWWVGMPAYPYPLRLDGRRSHERMRQMEHYAFQSFKKRKIPIIDVHSITEGMAEYAVDHSHYTGFVADTMAAVALQLLCQKWYPQTS